MIDSYYLLTLGSYRGFYILNWLVRGFGSEKFWDPIAVVFGVVQTAFYLDFAWVYYTRQRVKLRRGGVVDSEDLRKSWLVNKVLNFRARKSTGDEEQPLHDDEAEEGGEAGRESTNRWGARGISVAADDTLENHGRSKAPSVEEEGLGEILEDEDESGSWQDHTGVHAHPTASSPVARNDRDGHTSS